MESEAVRPRTLMLPPAPYVAAIIGGWWLDRNVLPLKLDWGAATQPLGLLLLGFSRNPIYLVDWCILGGVSLLMNTVWPLVFAPVIWAMLRFGVIRHEEAHLEAKFGDVYRGYKARVRRWV